MSLYNTSGFAVLHHTTAFMSNITLPALRMTHFSQAYVQTSTQNDSLANPNVFLQV
jgi:hypothetical protein